MFSQSQQDMTSAAQSAKGIWGSSGQGLSRMAKQGAVEESKPLIEGCNNNLGRHVANWRSAEAMPVPGSRNTPHPPNAKKFLRVDAKGQLLHIYVGPLSVMTHVSSSSALDHFKKVLRRIEQGRERPVKVVQIPFLSLALLFSHIVHMSL